METNVIILYKNGRKSEIIPWSNAMERFSLSGKELKKVIDNGTLINDSVFLDEALTY